MGPEAGAEMIAGADVLLEGLELLGQAFAVVVLLVSTGGSSRATNPSGSSNGKNSESVSAKYQPSPVPLMVVSRLTFSFALSPTLMWRSGPTSSFFTDTIAIRWPAGRLKTA